MSRPLADRVRPVDFDSMVGQSALVGKNGVLRRMVESGHLTNMIFFGPPGTGKTTAANIIAERSGMTLRKLNATTAGIADVKAVIDETASIFGSSGILLYLDEIQYFNRKQQQSLLEYIEDGRITLIASTTENPYFSIYNAILSRSAIFEFQPIAPSDIEKAVERALDLLNRESGYAVSADSVAAADSDNAASDGTVSISAAHSDNTAAVGSGGTAAVGSGGTAAVGSGGTAAVGSGKAFSGVTITADARTYLAQCGAGDVRRSLGLLENAYYLADTLPDGQREITKALVESFTPKVLGNFDRMGDIHYDLMSCLQKSIRGSDPDAAVFYLAKILDGGDLLSACRRLQVIASEDIGLAYPMAAVIVRSCVENARELGLPEAKIPLAMATVMLATSPKSNTAYTALAKAEADIAAGRGQLIPVHLQSPDFKGYRYPHDYPNDWVEQRYLPEDIPNNTHYYTYGTNKTEQAARIYWDSVKQKKEKS